MGSADTGETADEQLAGLSAGRLGGDILRYVPGTLGPAVGLLAFAAIFTRVFDTAEYGRYSLVFSVATLLAALFGQWLVQSINRFVGASGDLASSRDLIGSALSVIVVSVVGISLLLGSALWAALGPDWRPFILPGALMVLAWSLFQPLLATYQATLRATSNSGIRIAQVALRLGLSLAIVLALWRHPASLVLAGALGSGVLVVFMWSRLSAPFALGRTAPVRSELRRWASYGFPMIPWFTCTILLAVGDRYLIQWLRDSAELGIYAANYGIVAGGAGLIAAPIRLAGHPFLMRAWGQADPEETTAWLGRIITVLIFAMIVVVGPTVLLAEDLARILLGAQFREGYRVMPIALGGIALWQLGLYLHKPFEFHERTPIMMVLAFAAVAVSLVLNIALIPLFGYMAAAWNTAVAYGVYAVLTGVLGRSLIPWRIEWAGLVRPTALFLAALLVLAGVRDVLRPHVPYGVHLGVSLAILSLILVPAALAMMRMLRGRPTT